MATLLSAHAPHTIIAGGGPAGMLTAFHELERDPERYVTVVERHSQLPDGVAFSTRRPEHRLNVPAGNMSAFQDKPGDFADLLPSLSGRTHEPSPFVERRLYHAYLRRIAATLPATGRFSHVRAHAVDVAAGERIEVATGKKTSVIGDKLVVALGNPAPPRLPGVSEAALRSKLYYKSAWAPGAMNPLADPDAPVVIVGSALTAVDTFLALRAGGHRGPVYFVSRSGRVPEAHPDSPNAPKPEPYDLDLTPRELHAQMSKRVKNGADWGIAVAGIRADTNKRWRAFGPARQAEFRDLFGDFGYLRHRMPPQSAAIVHAAIRDGSLRVIAGNIGAITRSEGGLLVSVLKRGRDGNALEIDAGRVVNATGQADAAQIPFVQRMIAADLARPDPTTGNGIDVDDNGALIGSDGTASKNVFAIGAPLEGWRHLEARAMPEIRVQAKFIPEISA